VHGAPRLSQQQLDAAHYSPCLMSRSGGISNRGKPPSRCSAGLLVRPLYHGVIGCRLFNDEAPALPCSSPTRVGLCRTWRLGSTTAAASLSMRLRRCPVVRPHGLGTASPARLGDASDGCPQQVQAFWTPCCARPWPPGRA